MVEQESVLKNLDSRTEVVIIIKSNKIENANEVSIVFDVNLPKEKRIKSIKDCIFMLENSALREER